MANIFAEYAQPYKSVLDYSAEMDQADARKNALQQSSLALQQGQMNLDQTRQTMALSTAKNNAIQSIYSQLGPQSSPLDRARAMQQNPLTAADGVAAEKALLDADKTRADTGESIAKGKHFDAQSAGAMQDQTIKAHDQQLQKLQGVTTPQQMLDWARQGVGPEGGNAITLTGAGNIEQTLQRDPTQFAALKQQLLDTGVSIKDKFVQGQETARNAATNATSITTNALTNKTSRDNNINTQAGENARASASRDIEKVKADPYGNLGLNKNVPQSLAGTSNLSGADYLSTLPAPVASQVKMMAEGKIPITAMALRSPQVMQLLTMAAQYEPNTDATTYVARAKTAADFSTGGKSGQMITNANQALHHAGQLSDAIGSLNNTGIAPGIVNPIVNWTEQKLGGDSRQGIYKQKADALSAELRKVYAGASGGTLHELQSWQSSLDPNASKDQQTQYLQSGMELLVGAIQSRQEAYARGMGSQAGFSKLLSPESQRVLQKLAPEYAATLNGGAAPAGTTQPTSSAPREVNFQDLK